jgi:hypothetical protein
MALILLAASGGRTLCGSALRISSTLVLAHFAIDVAPFAALCWLLNSSTQSSRAETAEIWYHAVQSMIHLESIAA